MSNRVSNLQFLPDFYFVDLNLVKGRKRLALPILWSREKVVGSKRSYVHCSFLIPGQSFWMESMCKAKIPTVTELSSQPKTIPTQSGSSQKLLFLHVS